MSDRETFGDRFRRLQHEAGVTKQEIIAIAGWKSDSSFYKAARGEYDFGALEGRRLLRLARKLKVTPHYLANEPEPPLYLKLDAAEIARAISDPQAFVRSITLQAARPPAEAVTPSDLQDPPLGATVSQEQLRAALATQKKELLEEVQAQLKRVRRAPSQADRRPKPKIHQGQKAENG